MTRKELIDAIMAMLETAPYNIIRSVYVFLKHALNV